MKRIASLSFLAAALTGLAGCAGAPKAADSGEYEWVTPTGSNIAVKVPKGQKASVSTSPSATMSGDAAAGMLNSAGGKVPTDKGGR